MEIRITLFVTCIMAVSGKPKQECGYKQCLPTRDGALNVHLIPHSHMDAGWVKTFDEYYHGSKATISSANVQLIYHSVLSEILHDRRRRFTFSETAYFWRWWKEQNAATRTTFRNLVAEGRIQFAGGGWVQTDEATVDYVQLLDQYTWGLRKLNDTLGQCGKPRAAWQIDSYGHTREHASLLAQMGFDGLFIGRVDFAKREAMMEDDGVEYMWRGSDVLGKMSDIMTHTLYNQYNAPDGFCFDFLCSDEPVVDDPDSRDFNADQRVKEFVKQIEDQAKYYDHDHIAVPMGGDFTYQSAANWFINMDKLINHFNSRQTNFSDFNVFYSTPACYLKSIYLHGRRDKAIHTETGDHLPYGSDVDTYWTGFYTSRPALKYLAKRAHVYLQVVKQLMVLSRMQDSFELHQLRYAVSLVLHHDGITGTSLQHVSNDFVRTLSDAIEACTKKITQILSLLTPSWGGGRRSKTNQHFTVCHQMNLSQCKFTETDESMLAVVYNPLSIKTYHQVRLPTVAIHYSIRDFNDEEVEYQVVPLPTTVINLPGRNSTATQELCFEAENIPPLGFNAYYITPIRDQLAENAFVKKSQENPDKEQDIVPYISNEYLKVSVNKSTGLLDWIQHVDGDRITVTQNFYSYDQTLQPLHSGAYSFRPRNERPTPVSDKVSYHTVRGLLVKEIRQEFNEWVSQVIRLYRGEEFVELEWIVGPVPVGSDLGKEVVSIFKTNITSDGSFFTDSNSRQMMKRTCRTANKNSTNKKPVQACYYPVTSRICLQSQNTSMEMCVLTDRTQGGTSYNIGEVELMVHRRLLTDDGFGLEEFLNEEENGVGLVVRGKHRLFFGNFKQEVDGLSFSERASQMARKWTMEPWLFFTPGEKVSRRRWQNVRHKRYSAIQPNGLPRHLQILTLEPWKGGSVLLRLENTLEKPKGAVTSEEELGDLKSIINVDIQKIFLHHKVKMVRETTLGANQWLEEARQMDWSSRYMYQGGREDQLPEQKSDYTDDGVMEDKEDMYSTYETYKNYRNRKSLKHKIRRDRKRRSPYTFQNVTKTIENMTEINNDTIITVENIALPKLKHTITTLDVKGEIENKRRIADKTANATEESEMFSLTIKPKNKEVNERNKEETVNNIIQFKLRESKKHFARQVFGSDEANDDFDGGITKSIYEMYYKSKPRNGVFKPYLRSTIETLVGSPKETLNSEKIRQNVDKDFVEITTRRYKKRHTATKEDSLKTSARRFDNTKKSNYDYDNLEEHENENQMKGDSKSRRDRGAADDEDDDVDYDEDEGDESINVEEYSRRRRSNHAYNLSPTHTQSDNSEALEQGNVDFTYSLRPTQIRTYVVWFEEHRRREPQNM